MAEVFEGNERFLVKRRLGDGSMGVVYEAFDRVREEVVALKALRSLSPDAILRLKAEFRALADLHHPSFATLRELFEEKGQFFFTMDLVPGDDFLEHVRGSPGRGRNGTDEDDDDPDEEPTAMGSRLDEPRVRRAFAKLARAVATLHELGRVHRDLKPSNVKVTPDGEVVLLDFGLATPHGGDASDTFGDIVGTPYYMAPEQAGGYPPGPAADWYAFGVMLYEALTGGLPFEGGALAVLVQKQKEAPRSPEALVPNVPADLGALCMRLLSIEPTARPAAAEILRKLEGGARSPEGATTPTAAPTFVGRDDELRALDEALAAARGGRSVMVRVQGESGMGKTALVRRFIQSCLVREPKLVALYGRCHERETVPYKALDGVIDALARFLSRLEGPELEALMPLQAPLLGALFPVLRRVRPIAQATPWQGEIQDGTELRIRASRALRELFQRLAARRPVIVVTDDLHWADADGLSLWASVLRGPDAPPLLWLAPMRDDVPASLEARQALEEATAAVVETRTLTLTGLPAGDACVLAERLLGRALAGGMRLVPPPPASSIAAEAAGHPLFIDALVRHVALSTGPMGTPRLEDALWARVLDLEPDARVLLELAAVFGAPLPLDVARRALGAAPEVLSRCLNVLRLVRLVRPVGSGDAPSVEVAHDRIRAALLERTQPDVRRARHEALAVALESSPTSDPEAKAIHWHGAGQLDKASAYAVAAAQSALRALAFERAARLFAWALSFGGRTDAGLREMRVHLARALSSAGRSRAAAALFEQAAMGAPTGDALELQRLAAEQYLRSGHIDEGVRVSRGILDAVGVPLPEKPMDAVRGIIARRIQLRLRGLRFRRRELGELPQAALTRVDVFWSMATTLGLVDPIRGAYFNTRHLLEALRVGEPSRVVRALALEAAYVASAGPRTAKRTRGLLQRVEVLAKEVDTPYASAWWLLAKGAVALLQGHFADALASVEPAEAILRDRCVSVAWELATAQWFALWALACRGEMRALGARTSVGVREADSRGDLFGMSCHQAGFANLAWLARDEVAEARAQVDASEHRWSREGFQVQHWWHAIARAHIGLYVNDGALDVMRGVEEPLRRALFLRVQLTRIEAWSLRGRALVQAARTAGPTTSAGRAHLEASLVDARRLLHEGPAYAQAFGAAILAGAHALSGDGARAMTALEQVERASLASGMDLLGAASLRVRGRLLGGEAGRALRERGDAQMAAEDVRDASRMTELHIPGFTL